MTRSDWELHRSRVTGALVDTCDCENVETRTSVARGEQSGDTVQYSTVQYSTVQCSTVQYSTVQYSTVQYSTVQRGQR